MILPEPVKASRLAETIGARVVGDGSLLVSGINEIHKVVPGDLTFVDVPKYYNKALGSPAVCVLINQEVPVPEGKVLIVSDDPFSAYNRLVQHFLPPERMPVSQGPHAMGQNVQIHPTATIFPNVVIGNDVTVGANCVIYPNVTLYDRVHLGDNVIVHANSVVGSHAYYYKTRPTHFEKLISCGRVIVEEDVEIGAGCTIDKGVSGDTVIGRGTKLDNQVHIGHGVVIGQRCLIGAQVGIAGKTTVEDEVVIWGQAGLTKSIRIGKGAVIGAKAGVSKSLPGGKVYFGSPAQEIHEVQRQMAWLRMHSRGKD